MEMAEIIDEYSWRTGSIGLTASRQPLQNDYLDSSGKDEFEMIVSLEIAQLQ